MAIFHQTEYHYGKIYTHNSVWKFCGDHILIKFFFGCIIDILKNYKKMLKLIVKFFLEEKTYSQVYI